MAEASYVRHHAKKIAFLFSAVRHFAEALRSAGYYVRYVRLEDPNNSHTLDGEILCAVAALVPERVIVTEPGRMAPLRKLRSTAARTAGSAQNSDRHALPVYTCAVQWLGRRAS